MRRKENAVKRRILAGATAAAVGISCFATNFASVVSAEDKQYGDGYRSSFKGNYQAGDVYYDIGELYGHAYYDNDWNDNASDENYARYGWQVYDVKSFLDEDGNGRDRNGHIVNTSPFTTDINAPTSDPNQKELMCWQVYSSKQGTRYLERTDIPDFGAPTYAGQDTPAYYIAKGEVEQDGEDVYIKWTVRSWVKDNKTWIDPDVFTKSNLSDYESITTPDIENYFEGFDSSSSDSANAELEKMWDAAEFETEDDIAEPLISKADVDTWWDSVAANVYTAEVTYDGTINIDPSKFDYTTNINVNNLTDILDKTYTDTVSATINADVTWADRGLYHNNNKVIDMDETPWYSVPNTISMSAADDIIRNTESADLQSAISQQSGSLDSIASPITSVREINPVSSEISITAKHLVDMFSKIDAVDGEVTWNKDTVDLFDSTNNGDKNCIFVRGDLMNVLKDKVDSEGNHYVENENVSYENDKWYELFTTQPADGQNYYPYARSTDVFVDMIKTYANAKIDSNGGDCWIFDDSKEQIAERYGLDMTSDSDDVNAIYNSVHNASVDYDPSAHTLTLSNLSYSDTGYETSPEIVHATNCPIVNVTTDLMNIQSAVSDNGSFDEGEHKVKVSEKVRMTTGYQRAGGEIKARRIEKVPTIDTTATSENRESKNIECSVDSVIYDKVTFTGLRDGETYDLKTEIYDKTEDEMLSNEAIKVDPVSFVPDSENYSVDVKIQLDTTDLKGHILVVYETLYLNDKEIVTEAEPDNEEQTVIVDKPYITTVASDKSGSKIIPSSTDAVIVDKIAYSGFKPNTVYDIMTVVYDKTDSNERIYGPEMSRQTITDSDGEFTVDIPLDTTKFEGHDLVVGEFVYIVSDDDTRHEYVYHNDTEDTDQTVIVESPAVPQIATTATSKATGNHTVEKSSKAVIVDRVSYSGLEIGKEYTVTATPYDKSTGKVLDGVSPVTKTFTADETGYVDVEVTIDTTNLGGKSIVMFESVAYDNEEIASHKDINDKGQTVTVADVKTKAAGSDGNKNLVYGQTVTIVDTVEFKGLTSGETYIVKGQLVDKSDSSVVAEGETEFTADNANGSVEVKFTLDTTDKDKKTYVVFETLIQKNGEIVIGEHKDINDADQTVVVDDKPSTPPTDEPSTPDTPSTPSTPDTPSTPSTPDTPSAPSTPDTPSESSPNPPQTGDESNGMFNSIMASILFAAAAGCGLFVFFRKRKFEA